VQYGSRIRMRDRYLFPRTNFTSSLGICPSAQRIKISGRRIPDSPKPLKFAETANITTISIPGKIADGSQEFQRLIASASFHRAAARDTRKFVFSILHDRNLTIR